jgi:hypothetical protein
VRVLLVLALALAVALPGCASEGGLGFQRDQLPPDPYYKEYRELLAGEHHKDFAIPVDQQAAQVLVEVALTNRDQGLPLPQAPASLQVRLLAPDGTVLDEAQLDATRSEATLVVEDLAPGRYLARVDGIGASQDLDGRPYGAEYLLTVEIVYAQ